MASTTAWGDTPGSSWRCRRISWTQTSRPSCEKATTLALGRRVSSLEAISSDSPGCRPIRTRLGSMSSSLHSPSARVSKAATTSTVTWSVNKAVTTSRSSGDMVTATTRRPATMAPRLVVSPRILRAAARLAISTSWERKDGEKIEKGGTAATSRGGAIRPPARPRPATASSPCRNGARPRASGVPPGCAAADSISRADCEHATSSSPHRY